MTPLGYAWLGRHFGLKTRPLRHRSFLGTSRSTRERADGTIEDHFVRKYDPGNDPLNQLVFALKYDGLDLDLLSKVVHKIGAEAVAAFISRTPNGKYARQIGCWFEILTGREVPLQQAIDVRYTPLLDPERYVVAPEPARNPKWRVINNALGDRRFMPIIRRTPEIRAIEETDWAGALSEIVDTLPQDVLQRALSFFYFKETKSSFAIEREEPGAGKTRRFVALLHRAGKDERPLSEAALTAVQNVIVDERFREDGFRSTQNYVGETTVNFQEIVHLIAAPPSCHRDVMEGLEGFFAASEGLHPILRAAAVSFPFVFVHPFNDGNGRIHRYLIHDLMARGGIGGDGLILPFSAEIVADMRADDVCLEQFSKPLLEAAEYELDAQQGMTVGNPEDLEGFYRYPDVTPQAGYLANIVHLTISKSLPEEIRFLEKLELARQAVREIVDLPDRMRESLLMRLHKHNGRLARKRREGEFKDLTDDEIARIEAAFLEAFKD